MSTNSLYELSGNFLKSITLEDFSQGGYLVRGIYLQRNACLYKNFKVSKQNRKANIRFSTKTLSLCHTSLRYFMP